MSDEDDERRPDSDLGWSRTPDGMSSAEFRERLAMERSGSSKQDAWARTPKRWWRR